MKMNVKVVFGWAHERYQMMLRRNAGKPKPWTKDKIMQQYRFCNTFREDDKVTVWIRENWRDPNKKDPYIWFAMAVARLVNWPDSLEEMGYPVPWNAKRFQQTLDDRKKRGDKAFTGAYMIHCGYSGSSKALYLAKEVLTPLWADRDRVTNYIKSKEFTLEGLHAMLMEYSDLGSFMAAQIIADSKYTPAFKRAPDWHTFAAMGPGSSRGMNRILGIPLKSVAKSTKEGKVPIALRGTLSQTEWKVYLLELHEALKPMFKKANLPEPHAQDVQSFLCEYDKHARTRLGDGMGRPRSLYPGTK